MKVGNGVK